MKYSFVLPAYKASFLKRAIDSIINQTYTDFELIIVNDASPEDIDSIIKSYSDPRIRYYINKKNIGGTSLVEQWNYCVRMCNTDYFILASDDDEYDSMYLMEMDKLVLKFPEVNVFRPRVRYIDENNNTLWIDGYLKEFCSGIDFLDAWTKGWIGGGIPFYLFKRQAMFDIGGFAKYPMAWHSDDATILRMSKNGIVSTTDILFSFRTSGINISSRKNTYKDLTNKINASAQFYEEVRQYLSSINLRDEYNVTLKLSIERTLGSFIQNDRIHGQIFNASLKAATMAVKESMHIPFISKKRMLLRYVLFLIYGH